MRRNFYESNRIPESLRDYKALQVRIELLQEPAANFAEETVEEQQVINNTLLQREITKVLVKCKCSISMDRSPKENKSFSVDVAVEQ